MIYGRYCSQVISCLASFCDLPDTFQKMAANSGLVATLQAVIVLLALLGPTCDTAEPAAAAGSQTPAHCRETASQTSAVDCSATGSRCSSRERVFVLLKPDAVQRGLVASILGRLELKGAQLLAMKMVRADRATLEQHYQGLNARYTVRYRCLSAP